VSALDLPRAAQPFVSFPTLLRANGFAAAPEQTTAFLQAVGLLGPRSIEDVRRSAYATLAPPPERRTDFDLLFDYHFLGAAAPEVEGTAEQDDEVRVRDEGRGDEEPLYSDEVNEAGQAAAAAEALSARRLSGHGDAEALRRFGRAAPELLPRRRGYRRQRARSGAAFDLTRSLREAVRNDGEVMRLPRLKRKLRQRNVLLLIDVSGSMKARTEAHLRFAHAVVDAVERAEVFTFGTRLTRVTRALRLKNRDQALGAASTMVSDWDGGTRIGASLKRLLDEHGRTRAVRGATCVILSDGLDVGDPELLGEQMARLSRLAHRVVWLNPLKGHEAYEPLARGMAAALPHVDVFRPGHNLQSLEEVADVIARL
jgi:uncharacterized protein